MMEETSSNSTNSAAAALAPAMPDQKVNTTIIKWLIKSSNQQYDDQIVESEQLWTVRHLKAHLSNVYPSKPAIHEQKLIYSGQLLNDRSLLKDIIRSYKDVYTQHHILHLVCTPKNAPPPICKTIPSRKTTGESTRDNAMSSSSTSNANLNSSSTDGLRQRYTASSAGQPTTTATQPPATMPGFWPYAYTPAQNNSAMDAQALAAQQAAFNTWMWQAYINYMQQIASVTASAASNTNSIENVQYTPFNPVIPFPNAANFYGQHAFTIPVGTTTSEVGTPPAGPVPTATPGEAVATATAPATATDQDQAQPQEQAQQPAEAQPRFPNIVQEEPENRDWLDNFFAIMRLALFLTVLYLNSSPLRCLLVLIIAGGIYLYHIGVLRLRHERNNNDINRNNNAAAEQIRQGVQQVQQAQEAQQRQQQNDEAVVDGDNDADNARTDRTVIGAGQQSDDAGDNNSTSVIAFMRSFVISFFTSLLPETPAAL